jgi:hypothetical protein
MKIIDQRYLESGNRYSTEPCLLSILELEPITPEETESLQARLYEILPGLRRLQGVVGKRADAMPRVVELVQQTAIELRRLALNDVVIGFIGVVPGMQGRYRLVQPSQAAAPSLAVATQLLSALLDGRSYNLKAGLAHLRALADRRRQSRGHLMHTARTILMSVIPKRTFSMPSIFSVSMPSSKAAASS